MQVNKGSSRWIAMTIFVSFTINLISQELKLSNFNSSSMESPKAIITFDKTTYDFGTIIEGDVVSHVLTFTNTSDVPLIITNVRGHCGCTVPRWPHDSIMPGETASLSIKYDTKNKRSNPTQSISITANTEPSVINIELQSKIIPRSENNVHPKEEKIVELNKEVKSKCLVAYPNPTKEVLNLEMKKCFLDQSAIITIYSMAGELMAKREIKYISDVIKFSVDHYPASKYVVTVLSGNIQESCSFVVGH